MGDTTTEKAAQPRLSVQRINEMSLAYQQAGTLWAALELELFTRISEGVDDTAALARALRIKHEAADRLLTCCIALGLVEDAEGKLRNAADVDRYLVKGKPTYHGEWALYHKSGYERWKNLAAALRPPRSLYDTIREDPKVAREITTAGYHSSIKAGKKFARECDLSSSRLLLDLGGGSGVYSIMACEKYPQLRAAVWDFPTVLAVAQEFIAEAGMAERITTMAGDYIRDDYPLGVDAILLCGTLEPRSSEEHKQVLGKCFQALPPDGRLFLITNMLEDDKSGPLEAVCSNLGNVTGPEPWGRIHTAQELSRFLKDAGFTDLVFSDFVPGTYRRVTARKP